MGTGKWTGEQRWVAILVTAALLVLIGVLGVPLGPLRIAAGILVMFCAPGYALLLIVQPRQLVAIARFVLSVPLSMALAIAWGVVLNLSPFGVYPEGLTAGMALNALIFFGIAVRLRRPGVPNLATTVRDRWWRATAGRSRVRTRRTLPLAQIAGVVLAEGVDAENLHVGPAAHELHRAGEVFGARLVGDQIQFPAHLGDQIVFEGSPFAVMIAFISSIAPKLEKGSRRSSGERPDTYG